MRMYDLLYAAFVHRLVDWPCQISPFAIQFSVGVASVRWWEVPGHDKEMSVAVCSRRLRHAVYTWIEPHGFYCSLPKYVPACWEKWPPKQLKFGNGSWWHFSTGTSTSDWKNHMRGKSSHKTKGQPWSCFWQAWYTEPYLFTCMPIFGWILLSKGNFQLKLDPRNQWMRLPWVVNLLIHHVRCFFSGPSELYLVEGLSSTSSTIAGGTRAQVSRTKWCDVLLSGDQPEPVRESYRAKEK